ncbi:PTS IIA-like nitrogen regulatory protein PtsN [Aquisalimonas sp.]|uniref:PTS IIA-like nitrogen regulatory protein PtsN n=1 Tax=unclassified Aquisalimonas TaxID=2644645 RepID=UPI00344FC369
MIKIADLITPERIACDIQVTSKKRGLELLSDMVADSDSALPANAIFDKLISREKLGSTGLGHGVALPHARMDGNDSATAAFIRTSEAIDFDAFDNEPVDLLFALVVPEHFTDEHLQILARLAEMFSDQPLCRRLRDARDADAVYELLRDWEATQGST